MSPDANPEITTIPCPEGLSADICSDFMEAQSLLKANGGSMPDIDIDMLKSPAQSDSCTTDAYACFNLVSNDAVVPLEERQVALWPIWIMVWMATK